MVAAFAHHAQGVKVPGNNKTSKGDEKIFIGLGRVYVDKLIVK